jgi:hypothetical protein
MKHPFNINKKFLTIIALVIVSYNADVHYAISDSSHNFVASPFDLEFSSCNYPLLLRLMEIENRVNELPKADQVTSLLRQEFIKEIREIASCSNPKVTANTNYVLVLSGRASYLKNPIDRPDIIDQEDDYHRMNLGIDVARKITALRLTKDEKELTNHDMEKSGPTIIYNGRAEHNKDFNKALENDLITNYPHSKFLILDLPPDQLNSKGHFISIKQKLDLSDQELAIVTSAFHFPRIGRMISDQEPFNYFGSNVKIYAYLYDREFIAPGTIQDLVEESCKIPVYITKADLNREVSDTIIFNGEALDNCVLKQNEDNLFSEDVIYENIINPMGVDAQ